MWIDDTIINNNAFFYESNIELFIPFPKGGACVGSVVFLFSGNVSAQPSVKGRVTDQNGQPLPGVSVIVAGTTNGTMTGSDGSYVISVAKDRRWSSSVWA